MFEDKELQDKQAIATEKQLVVDHHESFSDPVGHKETDVRTEDIKTS